MTESRKSHYADTWDRYVNEDFPRIQQASAKKASELQSWQVLNTSDETYAWPGDEWGDAEAVQRILRTCIFEPLSSSAPARLCELASGAGRITAPVLSNWPEVRIDCFDVSQAFLDQMNERFVDEITAGRLRTFLLTEEPLGFYRTLAQNDLAGRIDAVYSFDAMVHVELHSLAIYIATAAAILKPGGLLAMNVADATNERGFQKLLFNAPGVFRRGGAAGPQFQFVSPEILRKLLKSMGFSCEIHDCNGRDLFFTARLEDADAARRSLDKAGAGWWPGG
jgi:SAM-dependent methyltransferase